MVQCIIVIGELLVSLFQIVVSAVPLRVAYGIAGLLVAVGLYMALGG